MGTGEGSRWWRRHPSMGLSESSWTHLGDGSYHQPRWTSREMRMGFSHILTLCLGGKYTVQVLWISREMQQFDLFNSTKELGTSFTISLMCLWYTRISAGILTCHCISYPGRQIPLLPLFYRWGFESLLYLCAPTQSLATEPQLPHVTSKWQSWNLTPLGFRTCALNH